MMKLARPNKNPQDSWLSQLRSSFWVCWVACHVFSASTATSRTGTKNTGSSSSPFLLVDAFLIRSEGSGGYGTGMTKNKNQEMIVVGTTFDRSFWNMPNQEGTPTKEITSQNEFTDCFVAMETYANAEQDMLRETLNKPSMCIGGVVSMHTEDGFDMAVTAGPSFNSKTEADAQKTTEEAATNDASQPIIQTVEYTGNDFVQVENSIIPSPYPVPLESAPVAMTAGDDDFIYFGAQDISSNEYDWFSPHYMNEAKTKLQAVRDYQNRFQAPLEKLPMLTGTNEYITSAIQIVMMNIMTGFVTFRTSFRLDSSETGEPTAAVLAAMDYYRVSMNDPGYLVIAGSTNGKGEAFGQHSTSTSTTTTTTTEDDRTDWDGYVALLDPFSGELIKDAEDIPKVLRIDSMGGDDTNDIINDICRSDDDLYLVGTTNGIIAGIHAGGAFVMKIKLPSLEVQWKHQESGYMVQGRKITCSTDGVYIGGSTVADLSSGDLDSLSPTQPDAFVAKYRPNGSIEWIHQIDTTLQEADNGDGKPREEIITGMELNSEGHLNVLMNSISQDNAECDIFLFDMHSETGYSDLDVLPVALGSPGPVIPNTETSSSATTESDEGDDCYNYNCVFEEADRKKQSTVIVAVLVPVTLAFLVFLYTIFHYKNNDKSIHVGSNVATELAPQQPEEEGNREVV